MGAGLRISDYNPELPFGGMFDHDNWPAQREARNRAYAEHRAKWEAEHPWNRYERWRAERATLQQEGQR